jgi:hypothetical protein
MHQNNLQVEFDQLIIEFQLATAGILKPDPDLGAQICAAYYLEGELPPLRLYMSAA